MATRPKELKYQGTMLVVSRKKDGTPRRLVPDRTFNFAPARDLDENDIRRLSDEQIADMTGGLEPLYIDPSAPAKKGASGYPKDLIDEVSGFRYGADDPPDTERKGMPASAKVATDRLVNGKPVDKDGNPIAPVHRGRKRAGAIENDGTPDAALTREDAAKANDAAKDIAAEREKSAAR